MNAAEHIVEAYFRLCRGCFTYSDVKVVRGNNRQLDLLAVNLKTNEQFHVEVGVTHQLNWCADMAGLFPAFEKKFLGKPADRDGPRTDQAKGKNYLPQILETYRSVGLDPDHVQRIWVCWVVRSTEQETQRQVEQLAAFSKKAGLQRPIAILSMREVVLPALQTAVATSNYDDEVLRTLSFLKQQELQRLAT